MAEMGPKWIKIFFLPLVSTICNFGKKTNKIKKRFTTSFKVISTNRDIADWAGDPQWWSKGPPVQNLGVVKKMKVAQEGILSL